MTDHKFERFMEMVETVASLGAFVAFWLFVFWYLGGK